MSAIKIRNFIAADIPVIIAAFAKLKWEKPQELYESYLQEQNKKERVVWVAFVGDEFAGYVTLKWQSKYEPFKKQNIPEIKDLNVLPHFRNRGIGTQLLKTAEAFAATKSKVIGIGVGLFSDYGAAQKLYVELGYIPDGNGITHKIYL